MKFEETLLPEKSDVMTLQNMIRKYNRQNFETANQADFAIYIKDDNENVMGDLRKIFGNWMDIDYLVIHESLRKNGLGRELLQKPKTWLYVVIAKIYFYTHLIFKVKIFIPNLDLKKFT